MNLRVDESLAGIVSRVVLWQLHAKYSGIATGIGKATLLFVAPGIHNRPTLWQAAIQFRLRYMPVTARCTNVNAAMIRNRMIAEMLHARPAFAATPSNPPVPAKNKTT